MRDPAQAAARRPILLIELDAEGILLGQPALAEELSELRLTTLLDHHEAACRLLRYLDSPERHELLPNAPAGPVSRARVSLDFFRHSPPVPAGHSEHGWTAIGEAMLVAATQGPTPEGMFFAQWKGHWYEVRWRRDDGNTPALLALSVR